MSPSESKLAFMERFDSVLSGIRRTYIGQAICWALLVGFGGLAALASWDFAYEVGYADRAVGLAVIALVSFTLAIVWTWRAIRNWSRPSTAIEIEQRFPELGQAVRTSVQFGGRSEEQIGSEGVAASLVTALAEETEHRAAPLKIDSIIPRKRFRFAGVLLVCALVLGLGAVLMSWEWRLAVTRVLLGNQPYTEIEITPGNVVVDEGDDLNLAVAVTGRTNRDVVLMTRRTNDPQSGWTEHSLSTTQAERKEPRKVNYEFPLPNISEPLEYRVVAGPARSDIFQLGVRFPLSLEEMQVEIAPPEYTALESYTNDEPNFTVIDGSTVTWSLRLDREPASASLILTETGRRLGPGEKPEVQLIPLVIDGPLLRATATLFDDQTYTIVAEAADGMHLPANKFRVRVRHDEPPQVWFEEPGEAVDVHSLAEVLLRIRARDDFGLKRVGIKFEVNNEEEFTLLEKDDYLELAQEMAANGGKLNLRTRDALERLLPLEFFTLNQKDSVAYYAFAEDNHPSGRNYTETDLRFIDIRPFRRLYRMPDEGDGDNQNDPAEVRTLEEIIGRQRFNLNRTIRLQKKTELGGEPSLVTVDRLANFEDDLARSTRELAEFLESREIEGSDLVFQASGVMETAVDTLNVGQYEISSQQQKDSLRLLIEARDRIEVFLNSNASAAQRAALRSFDRMQTQKLRRPQQDREDEENPERLVERLKRLADEQEVIYRTLSATNLGGAGQQEDVEPAEVEGGQGESDNAKSTDGEGSSKADGESDDPADEEGDEKGDEPKEGDSETKDAGQEKSGEKEGEGNEAADETKPKQPVEMTREELEQKQQDIALEAREIEDILNRIRNMSELARSRAGDAADATDQVSGSLDRGNTKQAIQKSRDSVNMLRELALNVEGVSAREAATKIGMSRDISGGLSFVERDLAQRAKRAEGASGGDDPESPEEREDRAAALAARADRLAERGETLKDILDSVVQTNSPGDSGAIREVDDVLGEGELEETVERMTDVSVMLSESRLQDARVEAGAIADNLEATSRRLDQIYRMIVQPRVEQLTQLESRAGKLARELNELETNQQISTWHSDAVELLDDLDKADVAPEAVDEMYQTMQQEGWGKRVSSSDWGWDKREQTYVAPRRYHEAVRAVIEELQEQMQEVILTDLVASEDEATPPKYRALVDRYIQVLSSDTREESE